MSKTSKWKVHATTGGVGFAVIIYTDTMDAELVWEVFKFLYPHAEYNWKESMPDDVEGDSNE